MPESPRTEPAAYIRANAAACWQWHVALTDQGFTQAESLALIGHMLTHRQDPR